MSYTSLAFRWRSSIEARFHLDAKAIDPRKNRRDAIFYVNSTVNDWKKKETKSQWIRFTVLLKQKSIITYYTFTRDTISWVSSMTRAVEWSLCICAVCVNMTVVCSKSTFVDILTKKTITGSVRNVPQNGWVRTYEISSHWPWRANSILMKSMPHRVVESLCSSHVVQKPGTKCISFSC